MERPDITASKPLAEPRQLVDLQVPGRAAPEHTSARAADISLLALAPEGFLDTTHFDTVRFPPPPWAASAFAAAAADGENAYSPYRGHQQVLTELAKSVGSFLGFELDPESELIITPGTQAGLFAAISSLVGKGTRVALLNPEYLFSERILRFHGANIGSVPLLLDGPAGPKPDLAALEREFSQEGARFLVFSHPNNPTGAVYSAEIIAEIARLCVRYDVTVIADELYSRLLHGQQRFNHLASEPGMRERTITLLGPSKTESLSGYRLGVVAAPGSVIDRMENILSIVALRAPAYAQHLLTHWLRDDAEWLQIRQADFTALRTLTETSVKRLPWLKWTPGEGTAYAWIDVSALGLSAFEVAAALLTEAAVLVSPGYQFGPDNDGHFRVCYARDEATWEAALDRMVSVLDKLATARGLPARTA